MKTQFLSRIRQIIPMFLLMFVIVGVTASSIEPAYAFDFGNISVSDNTGASLGQDVGTTNYESVTTQIKKILQWATGIMSLFMVAILLWQFTKLSAASDNEMARRKAMAGIATSGLALALFGGANIIVSFFWNALAGGAPAAGGGADGGDPST